LCGGGLCGVGARPAHENEVAGVPVLGRIARGFIPAAPRRGGTRELSVTMQRASPATVAVVEPVVTGLGYEFVGAEFGQGDNGQALRIYIDSPNGIDVEDCAKVSRQVDAALDVDDVVPGAYLLEVSSPGVDRPLFDEAQFAAQVGEEVRVRLVSGIGGRRNFKGRLLAVENGTATVEVDGADHALPLADVEQAYLIGRLP